jgi:predicted nucleotide-binding protein
MTKRRSAEPTSSPPRLPPAKAIELLSGQIDKGVRLLNSERVDADEYGSWELVTANYLEKAFGSDSGNVSKIVDIGKFGSFPMDAGEHWWNRHRVKSLTTQIERLKGLLELLSTEEQLAAGQAAAVGAGPLGHAIFLVHGHDDAALHEVARFLERLEQDVIVLREQPNQGRTIVEKFEDYAAVGFAVVLLTPDDRGGPARVASEQQQFRARQNVILELGYFLGRLGRNRVCALYKNGVEIPSDYSGVVYIPLDDSGGWRLGLAKELRAAEIPVDLNRAV